jgi:ABC-type sugar transport system ATPase subunit
MIQFEKVSKSFTRGSPVVDDFSLMVPEGRFVVLLGPSGSGKSTLLNLIAGLAQPEAGTICIDGKNMAGIPPHKRNCSMAFQNGICYDHWTVEKNIRSAAPTTSRVIIDEIIDRITPGFIGPSFGISQADPAIGRTAGTTQSGIAIPNA